MGSDDGFKRYLDMGVMLTQSLGATAEGLVKELIKTGEAQREQVDDMLERGRRGTELFLEVVRREVTSQLNQLVADLGLVTKADLADLERRLRAEQRSTTPSPTAGTKASGSGSSGARTSRARASGTAGAAGSAASARAKSAGTKAAKATTKSAKATTKSAGTTSRRTAGGSGTGAKKAPSSPRGA